LAANDVVILEKAEANTMIDDDVAAKLKHLSAQVAMAPQGSMAFPHGSALWGQQSGMSCITDMPAGSAGSTFNPAPLAAGNIPTDRAIKSARVMRLMFTVRPSVQKITDLVVRQSNDDLATSFRSDIGSNLTGIANHPAIVQLRPHV